MIGGIVEIILEAKDKATDKLEPVMRQVQKVERTLTGYNKTIEIQRRVGDKWVTVQRRQILNMRAFRMEMLSVMFFGMAITRTFGYMTGGAIEWLGIGELFRTSLNLIALQGLLPFTDSIYGAIRGILELPPATKETIGQLMLFGQIGGILMQTFGSIILGLSGLAMAFPGAAGPAAVAVGVLLNEGIVPLLETIPGLEKFKSAFQAAALAVSAAGAVETVKTVKGMLEITGVKASEGLSDKISSALSVVGRAFKGIIGGYLVFNAMVEFSGASATGTLVDDIVVALQAAVGAALITSAAGIGKEKSYLVGVSAAVLFMSAMRGEGVGEEIKKALLPLGIIAAAALPTPYAIPITLVISGVMIGGKLGGILAGVGAGAAIGAAIGSVVPGLGTAVGGILGGAAGLVGGIIGTSFGDFIYRPGHPPVSISPRDTIVGFKETPPALGNTINNYINVEAKVASDIDIDELAKRIGDEVVKSVESQIQR